MLSKKLRGQQAVLLLLSLSHLFLFLYAWHLLEVSLKLPTWPWNEIFSLVKFKFSKVFFSATKLLFFNMFFILSKANITFQKSGFWWKTDRERENTLKEFPAKNATFFLFDISIFKVFTNSYIIFRVRWKHEKSSRLIYKMQKIFSLWCCCCTNFRQINLNNWQPSKQQARKPSRARQINRTTARKTKQRQSNNVISCCS